MQTTQHNVWGVVMLTFADGGGEDWRESVSVRYRALDDCGWQQQIIGSRGRTVTTTLAELPSLVTTVADLAQERPS